MNLTYQTHIADFRPTILAYIALIVLAVSGLGRADLITTDSTSTTITLHWSAPGDDSMNGTAANYDIRYSTSMINDANWNSAIQASNEPVPQPAGAQESYIISALQPSTTYYIALKAADEADNWSGLSNVVNKTTAAEQVPPSAIANLLALNPTSSAVTLTWTAPGDDGSQGRASQYDIRYATTSISDANWGSATQILSEPAPQAAGSPESFTVSGLQPGTTYFFAIKSADEVPNWSGLSNIASAATQSLNIPPAIVDDLLAVNPTTSSITLSWNAPGADGDQGTASLYDIRFSTSNINDSTWVNATQIHNEPTPQPAGTQQLVTINGLAANTTYYFALKSADEIDQWSGLSNIASGSTSPDQDQTAPGAILNLLASQITSNAIALTWTAPGDDGYQGQASEYDIRYSTVNITYANWGTCTRVANVPAPHLAGTAETFTVNGLQPNTGYYIAIKTYDEVPNYSLLSNIIHPTTDNEHIPPSVIANLQIIQANSTSVTLRWTAPGDDSSQGRAAIYDIRYATSQITSANWNSAIQVAGEPTPQTAGSQEQFTVSSLQPEVTYYLAIKTADEVPNWSALSNVVHVATPDQTPPAAINDLTAVTGNDLGTINLNWTAPGDDNRQGTAAYYIIKTYTQPITDTNWNQALAINNPPVPQAGGLTQAFTLTSLNPGELYYVAMKSGDNYNNLSPISNVVSAEAKPFGLDGIDDLASLPDEYNLEQNYPNPFNPTTKISFALPEPSNVSLVIYDTRGHKVVTLANSYYSAGVYTIEWNGREDDGALIATGVYLYNLQANNYVESKKMVFLK